MSMSSDRSGSTSLLAQQQSRFSARFNDFLEKRIPPSHSITLSQQTIFIFPTRTGFVFGGLLLLLLLGAINYQNSLVYGVVFLLGSLFLVTILHTFRNLSGLTIELVNVRSGFVGEDVEFDVRVSRPPGRGREGIQLGWPEGLKQWAEIYREEAATIRLYVRADSRGWFTPGRILVETYYPLGLLRAWTWVDLDAHTIVYPKPLFLDQPNHNAAHREGGALLDPRGSDDFTDIRDYQPGDAVKHILWRSYARNEELVIKQYASFVESKLILDWEHVSGDVETRLSRLTGLALNASRSEREYGLRIPGCEVPPGTGESHLKRLLTELALFGSDEKTQPPHV